MRKKSWSAYKHLKYDKVKTVGEHKIQMPELPDDPSDVYFIDHESEDAYWQRDVIESTFRPLWFNFIPHYTKIFQDATLEDEHGALSHCNAEDSHYIIDTISKEMKRRVNGVHIRIKDEIVWIPGDMWFVLMWCKTKRPDGKDYFDFRFFQLDFFYLVHHVFASDWILGLAISKPKKTGITNLMWLIYLNRVTMTKNINVGAMNIDLDKAAKTFTDYFLYAFNSLPPILKPQDKNKSEKEGRISFGKSGGSRKGSAAFRSSDDELGSNVMCVPCQPYAFDVDVFKIIWYDEYPKFKNNFGEVYRSNSSGTMLQDFIVGKVFLTSYTPEDSGPSFMEGKKLFYDSELNTAKPGEKQTRSKLICYHIPSHQSWWTSFDKFGRCNEKEAYQRIMAKRNVLKDRPKELQAEIRKYAIDKKEAWTVGGSGSLFDPLRTAALYEKITTEQRENPAGEYVPGNFKWTNEFWNINPWMRRKGEFSPVYFQPLTPEEIEKDEPYSVREYYPLPIEQRNRCLSYGKDEFGNLNAPVLFDNVLGADPTQQAAKGEVIEGSKNSYFIMNVFNEALDTQKRKVASRLFMYEYYHRWESPDDSYDDLLKMIIFSGSLSAVEANAPAFANKLMSEGLGNYMLVKNKAGIPVIWERWMGMPREEEKHYVPLKTIASGDVKITLEEFVTLMKAYIREPTPGGKDYGDTIKSERIIYDCQHIDLKDATRKYDAFMGASWTLWAEEVYRNILLYEMDKQVPVQDISAIFKALAG